MDTSQEYIKMCKKAGEIQELTRNYEDSKDFWICKNCEGLGRMHWPKYEVCKDWSGIWLPRQDQLQEMVESVFDKLNGKRHHLIFHFYEFLNKKNYSRKSTQCNYVVIANLMNDWPSMEQLWLAFVMKKKFGKSWDGEEWR